METLLRAGDSARALDDFSTGRRENLLEAPAWAASGGGSFELLEGDIREPDTCRAAMAGIDFVLHQAAMPSVPRSIEDPENSNAVNVSGTLNLLLAARDTGVRRFVFASSSALYGESEVLPKVETMAPAPISPYGLQKLTAESYCRLFHRLYGVPTIALRYFNVFGARQNPESEYAAVVPKFMKSVREGTRPTVFGDGEQTRDFTHISNTVDANLKACEAAEPALGQAFNIACGERISLNRLVEILGEFSGSSVVADYLPPRAGDIRDSLADIAKARELLRFEPAVGVEQGLRQLWDTG
jgi:nucleoside-diphosphate-sugar epimerase